LQAALDWYQTGYPFVLFNYRLDEHAEDPGLEDELSEAEEPEAENIGSACGNCLKCNDCGKMFTSVDFAQLHATKTGHDDFSESTEKVPVLTDEEKTQRLAELREKLKEKRRLDAIKAEEEARRNEMIRRKATKDTAEIKRELEAKEAEKAMKERMREKQEDRLARERIKQQIEEDRRRMKEKAEAQRRLSEGKPAEQAAPQEPIHEQPKVITDSARLQIRLPNGTALRERVASSMTLAELMKLIGEKSGLNMNYHGLMIPLPPKNFDMATEGSSSLADLGLCPSATLVLRKIA
jgi:hypothetical protein